MEVAANAIIKIAKTSFGVAITGGTLDSMILNLTMVTSYHYVQFNKELKKDKPIISLSFLRPYYTSTLRYYKFRS